MPSKIGMEYFDSYSLENVPISSRNKFNKGLICWHYTCIYRYKYEETG
jgi:hypothetical protein